MELITFLVMLGLGYGCGRYTETRHFQSIIAREKQLKRLPVIAARFPPATLPPPRTCIVSGNVVVSVDYFKRFLAQLRNLVGGRVRSYETLLDRARREAVLRMKAEAEALGASMIFNLKLETASISKGRRRTVGTIEVLAYGTAIIPGNAVIGDNQTAVEIQ